MDKVNWATSTAFVRIEIWVKFSNLDIQKISRFGADFNKMATGLGWHPPQIEFRNSK